MLNIWILFTNYDIIKDFLNLAFCSEHFISIKDRILATFNINKKLNSDSLNTIISNLYELSIQTSKSSRKDNILDNIQHLGHKMFGNFWHLSYKDNNFLSFIIKWNMIETLIYQTIPCKLCIVVTIDGASYDVDVEIPTQRRHNLYTTELELCQDRIY